MANHLRPAHSAKGTQRCQEINGFENVGLSLRVISQKEMKAGREIRVQPRVIAKIPQSQVGQMHTGKIAAMERRREVFRVLNRRVELYDYSPGGFVTGTTR